MTIAVTLGAGAHVMVAALTAAAVQAEDPDDFPKAAYVMVRCIAGPNETPQNCRAVEVSHPGQGLESAALAIMRRGRIGQRQGVPVGQAYQIRVAFRLQEENEEASPQPADAKPPQPEAADVSQ